MKILLINPPTFNMLPTMLPRSVDEARGYNPPLGLLYLAAYLQKNSEHQVEILDCQVEELNYKQIEEKIKENAPDAIGLTTMTFTLIDVLNIVKIAKKINPEIKTILGGPHVDIYPEETINQPGVDYLVLGEGEKPLKGLLDNINSLNNLRQVKGVVFKDNNKIVNTGRAELNQDLDSLPFPARRLTPYQKYSSVLSKVSPVTTMFTSRGCPYKCLFCDRPHLGKFFRARSAKNVVDEMEECQKMGIKEILIYDDTFTVKRQRVIDICLEIQKRNLKIDWDVRARVDTVDKELLEIMKDSGCQRIHYGVEAGTQKILNVLRKGITLEQVEKAFKLSRKIGLETLAYFMIGSPTETKEDILETIKFAKKINPDFTHITITTPFPATDLYRMGLEQKIWPNDHWQKFAERPRADFLPPVWEKNLNKEELVSLNQKAYRAFYFRPKYLLKRLFKLTSLEELKRKSKAAWGMLKI
ncbi:B12-binding domain-containing radical SAM protein [Patescibacteria group bacterium]|nr:B12-binding domain-containing radical SAM protein [Patescibacteria group bacterium]MBU2579449.1 B12-binding domain-containing radical SAM protein [Patescibacteria group bacterium]MCG2699737.1 B12-binding domain-containing radical SAM protein [Candidatus Parcubacteria bacterium]